MKNDWQQITRRWLGRLTFSFMIVGFFLAWEGYKRYGHVGGADWQTILFFVGAGASTFLGFTGLAERHRLG